MEKGQQDIYTTIKWIRDGQNTKEHTDHDSCNGDNRLHRGVDSDQFANLHTGGSGTERPSGFFGPADKI
jgi:hypothetical protein